MQILHITVHLGAGAGKAIGGIAMADKENKHSIIVLDKPEKMGHIEKCISNGIELLIMPSLSRIIEEVVKADILIINWWHHPLLYKVINDISLLPSRLIIWSHINGLNYPQLNYQFAECFDFCLLTSSVILENKNWSLEQTERIKNNSEIIYGMGDFRPESFASKNNYNIKTETDNQTIKVGYTGSLDYAKIHPQFVIWIKAIIEKYPEVIIEIAGDVTRQIEEDVDLFEISDNVHFLGFRNDIKELLSSWDIFIYPLNPHNFATTENSLIEAMASGLPIITSCGAAETAIISNGRNGLLAKDEKEFSCQFEKIVSDGLLRARLGRQARIDATERYSLVTNVGNFDRVVDMIMTREKKPHDFVKAIGDSPFEWFISGCNQKEIELFRKLSTVYLCDDNCEKIDADTRLQLENLDTIFNSESKGSVNQYCRYYPENEELANIAELIKRYIGV